MNTSRRIVFNTLTIYAQTVLGAGLALFSSRWVLNALGDIDFGLFTVIGSIIIFLTFINSVSASSVSRHFAYSNGQGDAEEVNRWFNTAFSIHLCLASALTLIGWPIGEYLVTNYLTVPVSRVDACLWIFRLSLAATFFSMVSVPFVAMFTAKQQLYETAVWGIVQSLMVFIVAILLPYAPGDRLIFYAVGMAIIPIGVQSAQILRAYILFSECRLVTRHFFDKNRVKKIFSFSIWSLIGGFGLILRNQGSAILLNLYFGPRVNAAYGIANQVSNQTNQLSAAMISSFSPEITASEARGDRDRMLSLSLMVCKMGTFFVLLFAIPLMAEMNYVLKLWLLEPPEYTALLCQLFLGTFLIDRLSAGYMLAVNAHGKIAAYQATLGTCLILTLPISWLLLEAGYSPTSIGLAFIITISASSFGRVLWVKHLFGMSITYWFSSVFFPCSLVAVSSMAGALMPRWFMPESFSRLIVAVAISLSTALLTAWFFAFDARERDFFTRNILNNKLFRIFQFQRG